MSSACTKVVSGYINLDEKRVAPKVLDNAEAWAFS